MIRQISRKIGKGIVFFNKKEKNVSSISEEDLEEDVERERKISEMKFSEDQLRPAIKNLMDSGRSSEEVIGFLNSLTVCLVSAESIKNKHK